MNHRRHWAEKKFVPAKAESGPAPEGASPRLQDLFNEALQHHQAGGLDEAERFYRQILQIDPGHAVALHLLGVLAYQIGRSDVAFEPPSDAPPVGDLPVLSEGGITFGSFNMLKKITPDVVAAWSRILTRLPTSRLLLKTPALNCDGTRQRYGGLFAEQGIGPERLTFVGSSSPAEHMAYMQKADIALDSFPYSGGQTTLECLWMGLPVVTLPSETFASRHSLGYLSNIGLPELVAGDGDRYVELAVELASDLPRLTALRAGMRQRMLASPLCDVERFVGNLAAALTVMWRRRCDGQPAASFDV